MFRRAIFSNARAVANPPVSSGPKPIGEQFGYDCLGCFVVSGDEAVQREPVDDGLGEVGGEDRVECFHHGHAWQQQCNALGG
jgi:hypothetical protein